MGDEHGWRSLPNPGDRPVAGIEFLTGISMEELYPCPPVATCNDVYRLVMRVTAHKKDFVAKLNRKCSMLLLVLRIMVQLQPQETLEMKLATGKQDPGVHSVA